MDRRRVGVHSVSRSQVKALDLNRPLDARAYILSWTEEGPSDEPYPAWLDSGDMQMLLLVAKQIFLYHDLYHDPMPALGGLH
jgi:hypothetical protein